MVWCAIAILSVLISSAQIDGRIVAIKDRSVTIDRGREAGMLPGEVLDVYQTERMKNPQTGEEYEREVRAGGVLVEEVQDKFSMGRIISSLRPIRVGDILRRRAHNLVRSVSRTQNYLYVDLTPDGVKWIRPGEKLGVFRRMNVIHPITKRRISWLEKVGEVEVASLTIRTFSARCVITSYDKPILENDLIMPPEEKERRLDEIHILNISGDKLLLNVFQGAVPNAELVMMKEIPDNTDERFILAKIKVIQVYKFTTEVQLLTPQHKDKLLVGDKVRVYQY
ncbi:TPA: hypothetical protein EYP37_00050 [Candidatus Poribacteria bacterium]|nr:hypothetical protein [Candidatus Poribacteria bacterium]